MLTPSTHYCNNQRKCQIDERIRKLCVQNRHILTKPESKSVRNLYGIDVMVFTCS